VIMTPADHVGDITGDLSSKRGLINGTSVLPQNRVQISAKVPLSEMDGYQSKLKSLTGGQGSFTMEFSHYESVPAKVQHDLMAEFRPQVEAEG